MRVANIVITGDNKNAVKKIREVDRTQDKMASNGVKGQQRLKAAFSGTIAKLGGMVAAYVSVRAVMSEINKMADSYVEKEEDYHKLGVAVEMVGQSWNMLHASMRSTFSEMQAVTRFSDNEMSRALRTMLLLTRDFEGSQKNLALAMDMASSGMWNLDTSARYLAMAMEGNYMMLSRYVPSLRDLDAVLGTNRTKAEELDYVMKTLSETFGGLAKGDAQSFQGSLDIIENRLGDLRAETGKFAADIKKALDIVYLEFLTFVGNITGIRKAFADQDAALKEELLSLDISQLRERERTESEYYEQAYRHMQSMMDAGYETGGIHAEAVKQHINTLRLIREQLRVLEKQEKTAKQQLETRMAINLRLGEEHQYQSDLVSVISDKNQNEINALFKQEEINLNIINALIRRAGVIQEMSDREILLQEQIQMGYELAADVLYEAMGGAFDNVERMFINMIKRMIAEALVLAAIMQFTKAPIGGFSLGKILFPSAGEVRGQANGGDVTAGTPYMVGERGRELFVPTQSGVIIPNNTTNNIMDNSELIKEVRMLREAIYTTALTPEIISEANQVGNLARQVL